MTLSQPQTQENDSIIIDNRQSTPDLQSAPGMSQENPSVILDDSIIPSSFATKSSKTRKPCGRSVEWTPEMTTVLLRKLVYAIRAGKRSDNGFKIEVWNTIAQTVQTVSPGKIKLTGEKCQTMLETLRRKWKIWIRLKRLSGFGRDPLTGVVTAPDDVWEMEIKEQPGVREFCDRPMANAMEMREVFEGTQASGRHAIYPKFGVPLSQSIESLPSQESTIDSDSDEVSSSTHEPKRRKLTKDTPNPPLGRIRKRQDNPATRLVNAVERMITEPIALPKVTSTVHQAITKLRQKYKDKAECHDPIRSWLYFLCEFDFSYSLI